MKFKLLILAVFLVGCRSAFDHQTDEDLRQQACIENLYANLPPSTSIDPLDLWHDIQIYCERLQKNL